MSERRQRLVAATSDLAALLAEIAAAAPTLEQMTEVCAASLAADGKVLFAGNGGSAAQSQHLSAELVCRLKTDREPYAAIALTTDTSFLTACSNDYSFERVFARQIEALGRRGDVLVALSTGGRSPNVVAAAESARERGLHVLAFTGAGRTPLGDAADHAIAVGHTDPARIQEVHLLLGHVLCEGIEARRSPS